MFYLNLFRRQKVIMLIGFLAGLALTLIMYYTDFTSDVANFVKEIGYTLFLLVHIVLMCLAYVLLLSLMQKLDRSIAYTTAPHLLPGIFLVPVQVFFVAAAIELDWSLWQIIVEIVILMAINILWFKKVMATHNYLTIR